MAQCRGTCAAPSAKIPIVLRSLGGARLAVVCHIDALVAKREGECMMSKLIALGAVAGLLVGCGGQAPLVGVTQEELRCPYPDYCNTTNGTGVYFQEGGSAGIGKYQLLITHFVNWQAQVLFDGRFYDPSPLGGAAPGWQTFRDDALPLGVVIGATYKGNSYFVTGVRTVATMPVWTLVGADTVYVYGDDLLNLSLHISFIAPDVREIPDGKGGSFTNYVYYTLTFSSSATEPGVSTNPRAVTTLNEYNLQWHEGWATDAASANQYAYRAITCYGWLHCLFPNDPVVFQSGIDVDPVNGRVTPASGDVTMSARHGAPATAYAWGYDPYGYDPNGNSMFRFGAAIQMKRAAYCGDDKTHTIAGTAINVLDDADIESQPVTDATLEALWTPTGAQCWSHRPRRSGLPAFDGTCPDINGQVRVLPYCDTLADVEYEAQYGYPFVADGIIAGQ
jgi:hypothetical protein